MDSSVICHPDMIQKLEQQAKNLDLASQRDIMRAGGTDAGVMHTTRRWRWPTCRTPRTA